MKDKWLWLIIVLGLIFRLVNFEKAFSFAHDQDLYSWIAKDIIVNHHQRLVGQLTSVDGVFIGSFYYYLMAIFYVIFNMNPLSAIIPLTMLGVASIISIYWIVKENFNRRSGLIAAFIYATSFGVASFDRWSVPTQPTLIWSIWFLGVILGLYKGKLKYLPIYGFLVGFVWQLHIALIPILPIPILAYLIGRNKVNLLWQPKCIKTTVLAILVFLITISPFVVFEIKHNFLQIHSLLSGISKDTGGMSGVVKLNKVIETSNREFRQRILFGDFFDYKYFYWILLLLTSFIIFVKENFFRKIFVLFYLWIGMIFLVQFISKRLISEYYFSNLIPVYIVILALFVDKFFNKFWLLGLVVGYLVVNFWSLIYKSDLDQAYFYRIQVVKYIKQDAIKNNSNCIAINFIADPGVGVGFRYLFWYNGIKLVKPGTLNAPVYNIPIPWQLSMYENPVHFGRFGVLLPKPVNGTISEAECNDPKNQLDPLLGYTE